MYQPQQAEYVHNFTRQDPKQPDENWPHLEKGNRPDDFFRDVFQSILLLRLLVYYSVIYYIPMLKNLQYLALNMQVVHIGLL